MSHYRTIATLLALATGLAGCHLVDKAETTPAYIEITSIVQADTAGVLRPGPPFLEVHADLDGKALGVFELPARIPIPANGNRRINLYGGVFADGIRDQHVNYPFYQGASQTINLEPGQTYRLGTGTARASKETPFPLLVDERFEGTALQFDTGFVGRQVLLQIGTADPAPWQGGRYALLQNTTGASRALELVARAKLDRDALGNTIVAGRVVYAEVDYKCDVPFTVGFYATRAGDNTETDVLARNEIVVSPSPTGWKRIYVFLSDESATSGTVARYNQLRLFVRAESDGSAQHYLALDNIRLVTYK